MMDHEPWVAKSSPRQDANGDWYATCSVCDQRLKLDISGETREWVHE